MGQLQAETKGLFRFMDFGEKMDVGSAGFFDDEVGSSGGKA